MKRFWIAVVMALWVLPGLISCGGTRLTNVWKDDAYRARPVSDVLVLGVSMFTLLGIAKGDQKAIMDYMESVYRFFDAPAVVIIAVDKVLQLSYPLIDTGALIQTIALAALEFDLGTCIMRAIADYPEQVREIVGVPESKYVIIGMPIGYPD